MKVKGIKSFPTKIFSINYCLGLKSWNLGTGGVTEGFFPSGKFLKMFHIFFIPFAFKLYF